MSVRAKPQIDLSLSQIMADIHVAEFCIHSAERKKAKDAKPFKGQAGYHLQQASEKLIKIQLYKSGTALNYSKLYKHNLDDLIIYGQSLGITLTVPPYVRQHAYTISSWEARGRYDLHLVVRIDVLKKSYAEVISWYGELIRQGYQ